MRIIGGEFRSRKLKSVPGLTVRPTPDRLRESLFNILSPRIAGEVFVDAYAGSGTVGIEALSRGASRIILIERQATALGVIRENLESMGIKESATVVRGKAVELLEKYPADIAFIDPPYELENEYSASLAVLARTTASLAIAQHASRFVMAEEYGRWQKKRVVRQGDNSLSFFE